MSDKDLAIAPTSNLPSIQSNMVRKVSYLIVLEKGKDSRLPEPHFISLDKLDINNHTVSARGVFTDKLVADIALQYNQILNETDKSQIVEVIFPLHKVSYMKNLVFNAKK